MKRPDLRGILFSFLMMGLFSWPLDAAWALKAPEAAMLEQKSLGNAACTDSKVKPFRQRTSEQGTKVVMFFASWCLACRKHILASNPLETVYVVAFDDPNAATRALFSLFSADQKAKIWCELDSQEKIRAEFRVKRLPHAVSL
jgi:thiol-disulfide isomerase/thioredoxin